MSFYFQFSLSWLSSQSLEGESIVRILSGLIRLGLLARARDDGAWEQEPSTPGQGLGLLPVPSPC